MSAMVRSSLRRIMTSTHFGSSYTRQIGLWVLRAISPELARSLFFHHLNYADKGIAAFLRLPKIINADSIAAILQQLDDTLQSLENTRKPVGLTSHASRNLSEFARIFQLNPTETAILQYLACAKVEPILIDLQQMVDDCISLNPARYYLSLIHI